MWRELLAVPHALCADTSDASRTEDYRRWAGPPVIPADVREGRTHYGSWSTISISKDIPTMRSRGALELVRRPFESSCEIAELRARLSYRVSCCTAICFSWSNSRRRRALASSSAQRHLDRRLLQCTVHFRVGSPREENSNHNNGSLHASSHLNTCRDRDR